MDIQRLRNLTTGRLHTEMSHVYQDLEMISGQKGLFTHMLPRMMNAIEPWLRQQIQDPKFWEDQYDPNHVGEYELPPPTESERKDMIEKYKQQPDPLIDKDVIVVQS